MRWRSIVLAAIATAILAGVALAADGPPLPRPANGATVTVLARGLPLPAGLAFGRGTVFVAAFGSEDGTTPGGVFALRNGQARRVSDGQVIGVAWKAGTLYAAALGEKGTRLLALSGWDGRSFGQRSLVRRIPVPVTGLAFGHDGRLYAAGAVDDHCDPCATTKRYAQAVLSLRADGSDLRVVARGLRQPFGVTFAKGVRPPFVTVEGQEGLGRKQPPDYVVSARTGEDYGFPRCNWSKPARCASFAEPFALLPAHSSPTGIAAAGNDLFVGMFNGTRGPAVWRLPVTGGRWTEVVSGFPAPVVAVGASGGRLYVGDLTGTVYSIPLD